MCTVVLVHRLFEETPVIVGANRDERLDRPADPPSIRAAGERQILAPRDAVAGGTWLGVNDRGLVVAITNRFGATVSRDRRSRGELVDDALGCTDARSAADHIAARPAADYNGFHLLMADADQAHLVYSDGHRMSRSRLDDPIVVITERSFGAATNARKERVRSAVRRLIDDDRLDPDTLADLLASGDRGSIDAVRIDLAEAMNYGTRSSTILRLGDDPLYLHAEGAPGDVPYDDQTKLLRDVLGV